MITMIMMIINFLLKDQAQYKCDFTINDKPS